MLYQEMMKLLRTILIVHENYSFYLPEQTHDLGCIKYNSVFSYIKYLIF